MKNKKGMVLVVVTMVVMLLSVLVVGILSRNVTRAVSSEDQVKAIQAELLAKGAWWQNYQKAGAQSNFTETLEGVEYEISYTNTPNAGPGGTMKINTKVTY